MVHDTTKFKKLCQDALDVQNASNLCGVVQSFTRVMVDLGQFTKGTQARNTHPIATLWIYKISTLNNIGFDLSIRESAKCIDFCEDVTRLDDANKIIEYIEKYK